MFAVGDEKQSIFSFQGAQPKEFDDMRRLFARQFDTPELGWKSLKFHSSFRSGENVLGSVDQVFRDKDIYSSITTDEIGIPEHTVAARRRAGAGRSLAADRAGRTARDGRLGRAVRHRERGKPARAAGAPHRHAT